MTSASTPRDAAQRRYEQWLEAAVDTTRLLLADVESRQAVRTVARRLREVSGADYVAIGLVNQEHPGRDGEFVALEGRNVQHLVDSVAQRRGLNAVVLETGRRIVSRDITREPGYDPPPAVAEAMSKLGLGMYIPMIVGREPVGVMVVGWRRGSPEEEFAAGEADLVEMFASHAALALQRVRLRGLVLRDRRRIAGALRGSVAGRLDATHARLTDMRRVVTQADARRRLGEAIEEVAEVTAQLRQWSDRVEG